MTDYAKVLSRLYPDLQWHITDNNYDTLTMLDGAEKPSKKSLDDAWPDVAAEIAAAIEGKAAALVSARAKLAALGLTADEIAAFLGN